MYQPDDSPTQEITYATQGIRQRWHFAAAGLAVVLVLLLAGAVATCRGASSLSGTPTGAGLASSPPAATGSPSPSASPERSGEPEPTGPVAGPGEGTSGGSGEAGQNQGGQNQGGQNQGGQDNGGEDDDGDAGDPDPLAIAVAVSGPPAVPGCAASGTITATGGEYPLEVAYLWFRTVAPQVPAPFGGVLTVTFDGPGSKSVSSPQFPESASQNQVQLRVLDPQQASSGLVAYPKCHQPGLQQSD